MENNMLEVNRSKQSGFTLLEMLVVLGIIGILAGLVGPKVMEKFEQSQIKAAKVQIEELAQTLDTYKLDVGSYPTTDQGLEALITAPDGAQRWNGPYLSKSKVPLDPWNQEYKYASPGEHGKFDISSMGPDGKEGGEGSEQDIVSWE